MNTLYCMADLKRLVHILLLCCFTWRQSTGLRKLQCKTCTQGLCTYMEYSKKIERWAKTLTSHQLRPRSRRWIKHWKELSMRKLILFQLRRDLGQLMMIFMLYYLNIIKQGTKPSVLSLIPGYSDNYVPKISQPISTAFGSFT